MELQGDDIVLDNFLIASTDWVSSLNYAPLKMTGNGMVATRGTVRTFGNAGIVTAIPNSPAGLINDTGTQIPPQPMAGRSLEVSYCHVYDGGKVGEDTALLYGGGWAAAGTRWHHNWIHGTMEKCLRFDDQSENATVDHNVLYDCGEPAWDPSSGKNSGLGLVAKGDGHSLYANTIFQTNYSDLCMPSCIEKSKPYRTQFPRVVQNNRTQARPRRGERIGPRDRDGAAPTAGIQLGRGDCRRDVRVSGRLGARGQLHGDLQRRGSKAARRREPRLPAG